MDEGPHLTGCGSWGCAAAQANRAARRARDHRSEGRLGGILMCHGTPARNVGSGPDLSLREISTMKAFGKSNLSKLIYSELLGRYCMKSGVSAE